MSLQPLQFIWDNKKIPACVKVPEKDVTVQQVRSSCGIETDPTTGLRSYFVPKVLVEDSSAENVEGSE